MNMLRWSVGFAVLLASVIARAEVPSQGQLQTTVDPQLLRAAVTKSLPLLESSARTSMQERKQCFTCHNQGLPVMALSVARDRAFKTDAEGFREQIQFTFDFLAKNRDNYLAGKGQGGQALTAGYALWTLENGGWKPDDTTAAVAEYLLVWQKDLDHWKPQTTRPPSEESHFTASYVALRGLMAFGPPDQRERIERRREQVRAWGLKSPPQSTEDRVFRLRLLQLAGAAESDVRDAAQELLKTQREDGGWAQLDKMQSDAYATGSVLVALHQAGGIATTDAVYQRGLKWLLAAQQEDGSWHVATRSKPIQTYYESGYPHGADQFISITAAGWATTAIAFAAQEKEKSVNPGINKQFENPKVEEFIGRFEREGRDAYDHRHEVVKAVGVKPGMAIADIGAGTGLFTRMFSPLVGPEGKIFAVDIAENFVRHIEKQAESDGLKNIRGVICTPDSANLPPNSLDLAFICDVYHHFEFPRSTMRSIHRALKPGGKVVLIDFHRIPGVSSEFIMGHVRAGQEVFIKEITDAGFKQVDEQKGLLKESYFVRFCKVEDAN